MMDTVLGVFVLFLICCILLLVYFANNALNTELKHLPGPLLARISPFYRAWLVSTGEAPLKYSELHGKYGLVVRTGPNHVSLADPAMISVIYDTKNKFLKSPFYDVFKPLYQGAPMETVLTSQNSMGRRAVRNSIMKNMTNRPYKYQNCIEQGVDAFVTCMRDTEGEPVDFTAWSFFWGFDTTFSLIFGTNFGFMESRSDFNGIVGSWSNMVPVAVAFGQIPKLCPFFLGDNTVMNFIKRFQPFPDLTQILLKEVEKQIGSHAEKPHDCGDTFLCKVMSDVDNKTDGQSDDAIAALFEAFVATSTEIAATIRSVFYCLLTNNSIYDQLVMEIRQSHKSDVANSTSALEASLKLPLPSAVIKEALRLYPNNCPPMERLVPLSGIQANGHYLPEGTVVSVAPSVTHRDTEVFGNDADTFRPQRWLEATPSALQRMDHNFMAFGKGNRVCIGRELGILHLRMFIIGVLKNFDIKWASEKPQPELKMYWTMEHYGLDITFHKV